MWPFSKRKKKQSFDLRMFKGALVGRTVADWIAASTSIDAEIRSSLPRLRDRSRQLVRDNDYVISAQRTVVNNVVGQGIGCQSQVRKKRGGKLDEAINTTIENAWYEWQRKENCHTAGKLCFSDIERLIMKSLFESGEILIRFIPVAMGDSKIPLALETIEADLLDDGYNSVASNGNVIRMGVEMNPWGRPVAYYFFTKHPGDDPTLGNPATSSSRVRVPADDVLHLFITNRANQTRGVPWLHTAIMRLHHMAGYEESEVIAARATASLMGFIESPEGEASIKDGTDETGQSVSEFQPGTFKALAPGEKMNIPSISRPGGQFDPFMRLMLRGVAAGIGASYESISRDYSQTNYSSARQGMLEDRDQWRVLQSWMIANFHQPVFERFLSLGVLAGAIPIKDFELNEGAYKYPRWMPRGWSWVDPAKEVAAYISAVRAGFMTQTEVVAQSGGDFEELVAQRKREVELADENDLVFDTDPADVDGKGAAQNLAAAAADPSAPQSGAGSTAAE
jgi:lambda family phage portal protein